MRSELDHDRYAASMIALALRAGGWDPADILAMLAKRFPKLKGELAQIVLDEDERRAS